MKKIRLKSALAITLFSGLLFSCSPANIIVSGVPKKVISLDEVIIYNSQTLPSTYEIIGDINVQSESTLGRKGAHNRNISKLKSKAASVGANGLILGEIQNTHNAWGDGFMFMTAKAIFVSNENTNSSVISTTNEKVKTNSQSKIERLKELKQLLDENILTQEEFDKEKKKILDEE